MKDLVLFGAEPFASSAVEVEVADNQSDLVFLHGQTPYTTSKIIAEGTGNQHKSIIRLIQKFTPRFERWGKIRFSDLKSTNPLGGRTTIIAELNEQQAYFLITLLRNNDKVLDFKAELVDQFFKMKEILQRRKTPEYIVARRLCAVELRPLTDTIKDYLVPLMIQEGKTPEKAQWTYRNYIAMIQKLLGIESGSRDNQTPAKLYELSKLEQMARLLILKEIAEGKTSKEIFADVKDYLTTYAEISMFEPRFLLSEVPKHITPKKVLTGANHHAAPAQISLF